MVFTRCPNVANVANTHRGNIRALPRHAACHAHKQTRNLAFRESHQCPRHARSLGLQNTRLPNVQQVSIVAAATLVQDGAATAGAVVSLNSIELQPIVNVQGYISPDVNAGHEAFIFSIYDAKQHLQYIGFSKDLRNSLRTVFGRRPDKAHFYRATSLEKLDQHRMIEIRDSWFVEVGGAPPGNHLALERTAWQQPVDAGAISQRGKKGAADEKATQLLRTIRERGCKEEFVANPALLVEGMVDFLPVSSEDQASAAAAAKVAAEAAARLTRMGHAVVDGQEKQFTIHYRRKFPTNNGFMMDITVTYDNQETEHRVIIGKEYYEAVNVLPEQVIEAAIALLLEKKLPRQTEGMLLSSQFPVNYFSTAEVEQWYPEEFAEVFDRCTGAQLGDIAAWRFNRLHDYGPATQQGSPVGGNISVGLYQ